MKLRKNDSVMVLSGKDKGKTGKIAATLPRDGKVVVEGVAMVKRHTKPTQAHPKGGIQEKNLPILAAKVALVCPSCKKPTRIGFEVKNGEKRRICKKCNKVIS